LGERGYHLRAFAREEDVGIDVDEGGWELNAPKDARKVDCSAVNGLNKLGIDVSTLPSTPTHP